MSDRIGIYCIGVGGFGIGALSNVLSRAAQIAGLESLGSETHGLAQRGGTVVSTIFVGKGLSGSPLMIEGSADIVIALEPLEALRAMTMVKPGGAIIYNTGRILPSEVRLRQEEYPGLEAIESELKRAAEQVIPVQASAIAKKLGFSQASNMVILGILTRKGLLPFGLDAIKEAVQDLTPQRFHEVNFKALEAG
jgi:indolepyruvate ferredoxin oxidoreductase beta subunit